jgi:hypothetical protein
MIITNILMIVPPLQSKQRDKQTCKPHSCVIFLWSQNDSEEMWMCNINNNNNNNKFLIIKMISVGSWPYVNTCNTVFREINMAQTRDDRSRRFCS